MLQRIWTKTNKPINAIDILQVWDSGSMRYERIGNREVCWKVVDRSETETGFIETLIELPAHEVPSGSVWKEESPVAVEKTGFHIPGWSVQLKR
jgi:hypothetical protein